MPRVLRVTFVATCLIALAACGSSGDDGGDTASSTGITTADGGSDAPTGAAGELDAACADAQQALDTAAAGVGTALDEVRSATSADEFEAAVADLQDAVGGVETALTDFKSAVEAVDVPDDLSDAVDQLTAALDDQIAVAQQIGDSPTDSVAAIEETLTNVQSDDEAARTARTEAADALGASSCAPTQAGGSGSGSGAGGGATTTTGG